MIENDPQPGPAGNKPKVEKLGKKKTPSQRAKTRKDNLQKLQKDAIVKIKNGKDLDAQRIIYAYKHPQDQEHDYVVGKLKELEDKMTGLTFGSVRRMAYNKAQHAKNIKELKQHLAAFNIDYSDIPDKQLIELVALDNWGTIFKAALPFLIEYGKPILQKLLARYVQPRIDKFMGGDEGINSLDWGGVLGPRRFTPVEGENVVIPGVRNISFSSSLFNTVDTNSLKSVLCPELHKARYAYTQMMKTSLACTTAEYSITSNANGAVGVSIFPFTQGGDGTTYLVSIANVYNGSTFNVATGTQTTNASLTAGPLNGSATSMEIARVTNVSLQVIPTASFNTAGAFTLGYQNRWGSSTVSATNMGVTLTQLKMWPYVTSFNNKTIVRMITVSGDSADDEFVSATAGNQRHNFTLIGSGLPASSEVCRLVLTAVVEFIPSPSALPICAMDFPHPGPLTEQFESMMFARFPVLQQLDLIDAKKVIDALPEVSTSYDSLLPILSAALSGVQPRMYAPHTEPTRSNLEIGSLPDLIME